jgi:hypothetical protein
MNAASRVAAINAAYADQLFWAQALRQNIFKIRILIARIEEWQKQLQEGYASEAAYVLVDCRGRICVARHGCVAEFEMADGNRSASTWTEEAATQMMRDTVQLEPALDPTVLHVTEFYRRLLIGANHARHTMAEGLRSLVNKPQSLQELLEEADQLGRLVQSQLDATYVDQDAATAKAAT